MTEEIKNIRHQETPTQLSDAIKTYWQTQSESQASERGEKWEKQNPYNENKWKTQQLWQRQRDSFAEEAHRIADAHIANEDVPPVGNKQDTEKENESLKNLPEREKQKIQFVGEQINLALGKKDGKTARQWLKTLEKLAVQDGRAEKYFLLKEELIAERKPSEAELPNPPESAIEREKHTSRTTGDKQKPRVNVYLGMILELQKKLLAKGIAPIGISQPNKEIVQTIRKQIEKKEYRQAVKRMGKEIVSILRLSESPAEKDLQTFYAVQLDRYEDNDQVLLAVLSELNTIMAKNRGRFDHYENGFLRAGQDVLKKRLGDQNPIYRDLVKLCTHAQNFREFIYDVWQVERGGSSESMGKILSQAGSMMGNGVLSFFAEDPEVERAFHEIKGVVDVDNDFLGSAGARRQFKDPNTGEVSEVVVHGGDRGGAEKIGHYMRWILGWGVYDGYKACAANAYMLYKIHWWPEYAISKGWMDGTKSFIHEFVAGEGAKDREIRLHGISAWPSAFLAPNRMAEVWSNELNVWLEKKPTDLFADEEFLEREVIDPQTGIKEKRKLRIRLQWRDKARMLVEYGTSDSREWTYTREEFEDPLRFRNDEKVFGEDFELRLNRQLQFIDNLDLTGEERQALNMNGLNDKNISDEQGKILTEILQKAMFRKAVGIWRDLSKAKRADFLKATLLNDRWIKSFDFTERKASYGVKPVIDMDSKDSRGDYRISIADLLYYNNSQGTADNWINNLFTYKKYETDSEKLWELLGRTDPLAMRELWKNLLEVFDPMKYGRHLYGERNEKTGEASALLEKYEEETGWIMEAMSPMILEGPFIRREHGQREEAVAIPLNEYLSLNVYKSTYERNEFRPAGQSGHNWSNLLRNPLDMSGRVAMTLVTFNDEDVWTEQFREILKDTEFRDLSDDEIWWAILSFAKFKIKPNEEKDYTGFYRLRERAERKDRSVYNHGRIVHYYNFALDPTREWGRKGLSLALEPKLGKGAFDRLMNVLGVGCADPRFNIRDEYQEQTVVEITEQKRLRGLIKTKQKIQVKKKVVVSGDKLRQEGTFSVFNEYRDREEIIMGMIRKYDDRHFVDNQSERRHRQLQRNPDGTLIYQQDNNLIQTMVQKLESFKNPLVRMVQRTDAYGNTLPCELEVDISKRVNGLQWDPLDRDGRVRERLRDRRNSFTGRYISEQMKTDPNKKIQTVMNVNGKAVETENNVIYTPHYITLANGNQLLTGYFPTFSLFHEHKHVSLANGADPVACVSNGTYELYMDKAHRISPLPLYFSRDEQMYKISLVNSIQFIEGGYRNSGLDWKDDLGWLLVPTPHKWRQFVERAKGHEGDPDWAYGVWGQRWNCMDAKIVQEFTRKSEEVGIPDFEQRKTMEYKTDEAIEALGTGAYKILEGVVPGPVKSLIGPFKYLFTGRNIKEIASNAGLGLFSSGVVNLGFMGVSLIATLGVEGGATINGGLALWNAAKSLPSGFNWVGMLTYIYLTGLPGVLALKYEPGIDRKTLRDKLTYDQSRLGEWRRNAQSIIPFSRYRERQHLMSLESMLGTNGEMNALWDDVKQQEMVDEILAVVKKHLQTKISSAG